MTDHVQHGSRVHSKLIREHFDIFRDINCEYLIVQGDVQTNAKELVSEQRASDISTTKFGSWLVVWEKMVVV